MDKEQMKALLRKAALAAVRDLDREAEAVGGPDPTNLRSIATGLRLILAQTTDGTAEAAAMIPDVQSLEELIQEWQGCAEAADALLPGLQNMPIYETGMIKGGRNIYESCAKQLREVLQKQDELQGKAGKDNGPTTG